MNYDQVMTELKKMGTAQNIKVYKRHGAGDNLFGVSFADLGKLHKRIKTNHDLAVRLWESGDTDAQTLATMIADPDRMTESAANQWARGIDYYVLADLFASLIARTSFADTIMKRWMDSNDEYIRQAGYSLLAARLKFKQDIPADECSRYLENIRKRIHTSPNRARHAMNNALIAIGIYKPALTEAAITSAGAIGKVDVDHGETSCKTPDAISYIRRAISRKKAKK